MVDSWGKPESASFEKRSLRWALYADNKIQVHKHIWQISEAMLARLGERGIPAENARTDTDDPHRKGFHLELTAEQYADVVEDLNSVGFVYDIEASKLRFVGDIVFANQIAEALQSNATQLAAEAVEEEDPSGEDSGPAWAPDSPEVEHMMRLLSGNDLPSWQTAHGVARTGVVDEATLGQIKPSRPMWFRPGHTGNYIKTIQAAFKVRGYFDGMINGVWGIELSRSLRRFQADHGLVSRLRIGQPEWERLFAF